MFFEQVEFANRRERLLEQIENSSVVLLSGAKPCVRNNDCDYTFRQNSDFYYLTGFVEPEAFLLLTKDEGQTKTILFNREKNYQEEQWEGIRAGQQGAVTDFGTDEAYPITELTTVLPQYLANKTNVYYQIGLDAYVDQHLTSWIADLKKQVRKGVQSPTRIIDISEQLSEMRLIKSEAEIQVMRTICDWSATAHCEAMKAVTDAKYEYQQQTNKLN